jgi:hypothetical protein
MGVLLVALVGLAVLAPGLLCGTAAAAPSGSDGARSAALTDAGIARYRARAFRDSVSILSASVAEDPRSARATLYLALSHLQLGEDAAAERYMLVLHQARLRPHLRSQIGRVLDAMRAGPISPPLRDFIAVTLEDTMASDRTLRPRTFADYLFRNFPHVP